MPDNVKMIKYLLILSLIAFFSLIMSSGRLSGMIFCVLLFALTAYFILKRWNIEEMKKIIKPLYVLISLLVCSTLFFSFFQTQNDYTDILPLIIFIGLLSVPIVVFSLSYIIESAISLYKKTSSDFSYNGKLFSAKAVFFLIFLIYIIALSSLMRANYFYADDMARTARGYRLWFVESRFFSDGFASLLQANSYMTDISPLTQLLAALIMAGAGIILLRVILNRAVFTLWEIAALIPFAINPYFLECFSYKFDSAFMAMSVFFAIAPLLFREGNHRLYIAVTIISSVAALSTYQVSIGIFPILVILLALRDWMKNTGFKSILHFIINSVTGYLTGCLFFALVIMIPFEGHATNTLPPVINLVPTFVKNISAYANYILSDFSALWLFTIAAIALAFVISGVLQSRRNKVISLLVNIICLPLVFIMCFAFYSILETPIYEPRSMYCFGILISAICIYISEAGVKKFLHIPAPVLSWMFFVFSFTYGNALYIQKEYADFRTELIINDLIDLPDFTGEAETLIAFEGSISHSPVVEKMAKHYPVLKRLVPVTLRSDKYVGVIDFFMHRDLRNVEHVKTYDEPYTLTENAICLTDTMYHTIYEDNDIIYIYIK